MKKVEMHVPNKSYEGYYGGVKFTKGVGVFEDVALAKDLAERYGYEIVEIKEGKEVEKAVEVAEETPAKPKRTRKKAEPKAGE
ncbi:hypothetical protein ORN01_24975 [Bacillus cereus]|uniref:hypothetical protein n=1 Tax=Bacillus cereus group TaxID=86661 RepID=UPI0022E0C390|nr:MULTISPECIES: hypothetical protein [Bacillus cereus group]MDA1509578.1 hypothetical protein [Bacillus cereus group sp. TH36-2LC]MDZ4632211.1 hypothetical protein [Bacillus cereus]